MRERVKIIGKLPLSPHTKAKLLLVYAGMKPSTAFCFRRDIIIDTITSTGTEMRAGDIVSEKEVQEIALALSLVGIPYLLITKAYRTKGYLLYGDKKSRLPITSEVFTKEFIVHVAKNREWLERKVRARTDEESGICYGFPPSAIEAYVGKRKRLRSDKKFPVELKAAAAIAWFIKSKDNWREELKTGELWAEAVRELNPTLYDALVNPEKYGLGKYGMQLSEAEKKRILSIGSE